MENMQNIIIPSFYKIFDSGYIWVLLLGCFIYLCIKEKDQFRRALFIGSSILFLCVYFCPLSANIFIKMIGEGVYHRVFWSIPLVLLIAYGFVHILRKLKGVKRFCVFLCFCGMIMFSGKNVFTYGFYVPVGNSYRIWDDVIEALDYVPDNSHIFTSATMLAYVRQYNPTLTLAYSRWWDPVKEELHKEDSKLINIIDEIQEMDCDYLVFIRSHMERMEGSLEDYGYEIVGETYDWIVYKNLRE